MKLTSQNLIFIFLFVCFGISLNAQNHKKEIPKDTSFNIHSDFKKNSKYFPFIKPLEDELPPSVNEHRNVVYTTLKNTPYGDRDLHLDIFSPKKLGKHPALIMVHGGGWRSGNKSLQVPMAQKLAERGYVTVCVEYQLSLEAQYPAAVFNIKSAIRWMRAHAETYNIDTEKIAISGCSAGGQLAMLTGLTNGIENKEGDHGNEGFPSNIQAIIDIDGVVNFMAPTSLNLNRRPDSPDVEWLGGTFTEKPEVWKDASSIYWANETSPPILFLNSGYPRFHAGQDELVGMMTQWGIYTEVHQFNEKIHTFWLYQPWANQTINYIDNFLMKVFQ